jgi:hypothetical protein
VGIVVGGHIVTGVKLHIDGFSIALPCVVFWAPVVIDMVGVTVVVTSRASDHILASVIARHLDEVEGGVAVAAHVAHVHCVRDVVAQNTTHGRAIEKPSMCNFTPVTMWPPTTIPTVMAVVAAQTLAMESLDNMDLEEPSTQTSLFWFRTLRFEAEMD